MTAPATPSKATTQANGGHRVRGGLSGLFTGLGMVVLLQQYAVMPLTVLVLVLLPLGFALLGVAIGWPRPTPAAVSPPASSASPPGGAP